MFSFVLFNIPIFIQTKVKKIYFHFFLNILLDDW